MSAGRFDHASILFPRPVAHGAFAHNSPVSSALVPVGIGLRNVAEMPCRLEHTKIFLLTFGRALPVPLARGRALCA